MIFEAFSSLILDKDSVSRCTDAEREKTGFQKAPELLVYEADRYSAFHVSKIDVELDLALLVLTKHFLVTTKITRNVKTHRKCLT